MSDERLSEKTVLLLRQLWAGPANPGRLTFLQLTLGTTFRCHTGTVQNHHPENVHTWDLLRHSDVQIRYFSSRFLSVSKDFSIT